MKIGTLERVETKLIMWENAEKLLKKIKIIRNSSLVNKFYNVSTI